MRVCSHVRSCVWSHRSSSAASVAMKLASFISLVAGVASALQPSAVSCSTDVAPGSPLGTTAHANSSGYSSLTIHGDDFVPDYVLDVTYQNISVACQSRLSAVVNGTSPGPALRIPAGKTTWIRVYNSMSDYNLTMVGGTCRAFSPCRG